MPATLDDIAKAGTETNRLLGEVLKALATVNEQMRTRDTGMNQALSEQLAAIRASTVAIDSVTEQLKRLPR